MGMTRNQLALVRYVAENNIQKAKDAKPDMTVQYYLIDDIEEMQHKYNRVA